MIGIDRREKGGTVCSVSAVVCLSPAGLDPGPVCYLTIMQEVRTAMDTLGMSSEEQLDVLRVVATVLHFGNVKFDMVRTSVPFSCIMSQ